MNRTELLAKLLDTCQEFGFTIPLTTEYLEQAIDTIVVGAA